MLQLTLIGPYPVMKIFKKENLHPFFQWKVTLLRFGWNALRFVMLKMNLHFSISFTFFQKVKSIFTCLAWLYADNSSSGKKTDDKNGNGVIVPKRDQLGDGRPVPETGNSDHMKSFWITLEFVSQVTQTQTLQSRAEQCAPMLWTILSTHGHTF